MENVDFPMGEQKLSKFDIQLNFKVYIQHT